MRYNSLILSTLSFALLLGGCSSKDEEVNKPADYWYKKIVKESARFDLEKADEAHTSLRSEHIRSPLLPEATLLLALAHIDNEEYMLANFYLDDYAKRFGDKKNNDFIKYLKIKANFKAFKQPGRDQNLLLETIEEANNYLKEYKTSPYAVYVESILVKLELARDTQNKNIASLYKRIDKPQASKFYEDKTKASYLKTEPYQEPERSMIRRIVE